MTPSLPPTKHHHRHRQNTTERGLRPAPGVGGHRRKLPDLTAEPPPQSLWPRIHPEVWGRRPDVQLRQRTATCHVWGRRAALAGVPAALAGEGLCRPWPHVEKKGRRLCLPCGLSLTASSGGGDSCMKITKARTIITKTSKKIIFFYFYFPIYEFAVYCGAYAPAS
jgi:hypothetical protein